MLKNGKHGLLSISEFAAYCGSTRQTMQYYDRIGLLRPMRVGEQGYRYYHPLQGHEFRMIHTLRTSGCSLNEIEEILGSRSIEALQAKLREKREALELELENIRRQQHYLARTEFFLTWMEHSSDCVPRIRRIQRPMHFRCVPFSAPTELYSDHYYEILMQYARQGTNGGDIQQYPYMFYVEQEELRGQRRFSKMLCLPENMEGPPRDTDYVLRDGLYLRMLYYPQRVNHTRKAAYEQMLELLEQENMEPRDGCLEMPFCIPEGLRQNEEYPFTVLYIMPIAPKGGKEAQDG